MHLLSREQFLNENLNESEESNILLDSKDVYEDGQLGITSEGDFIYTPEDHTKKAIQSKNPEDFKTYVNPEALKNLKK